MAGREPRPRDGGASDRFDYAGYFRRIRNLERLSLAADEVSWQEKYEAPEHPVEVLLYLGCNVLITSHLAIEVVKVFQTLGVDFQAIGGPQFCCGIVHHGQGDLAAADRLSSATLAKMSSYDAQTLVMWCPSCELHFDDVVLPGRGAGFGPRITHATQFLADRLDDLAFRHPVPLRVALHTHTGHPRQERDARAATALLDAVPGVEVVGTLSSPRMGYHCPTPANATARQAFDAERAELLSTARELGADTVATLYHSCHREWCAPAPEALTIRNYISIVAQSLGCAAEDRHSALRGLADADSAVAASREQWATHGWSEDDARAAVSALRPRQAYEATDNG